MTSLFVFDKFMGYAVGGAQRSLEILLGGVADLPVRLLGCEVKRAFGASQLKQSERKVERVQIIEIPRLPYIEYLLNRRRVRRFIRSCRSQAKGGEVLVTQGLWGATALCAWNGRSVYFIRDEYQLNRIPFYQRGVKKWLKVIYLLLQLPGILILWRDNRRAIHKADVVVANSQFIQREIEKTFGRKAALIYSPIERSIQTQPLPASERRPYVTLIGSEYMKGRPVVERLARALPEKNFLIVGREIAAPYKRENIFYQPWTRDVHEIFSKTHILLIPSLCNEAFPRVALEALAQGIPVIGSNRGGTPEIVPGEYVIDDPWKIEEWVQRIQRVEEEGAVDHKVVDALFERCDATRQQEVFRSLIRTLSSL